MDYQVGRPMMDKTNQVPACPLSEYGCPVCGGFVTGIRSDGGTWVHGEVDKGSAGCNAILKIADKQIQCVARKVSILCR